ncbi:DUF2922 domain-containing protein [Bacillus infantis]
MMAKTLEIQFLTENGKTASLTVDSPKEPIDTAAVKQAMEELIAADIFAGPSGKLVSAKGARVIDRSVTEYELV